MKLWNCVVNRMPLPLLLFYLLKLTQKYFNFSTTQVSKLSNTRLCVGLLLLGTHIKASKNRAQERKSILCYKKRNIVHQITLFLFSQIIFSIVSIGSVLVLRTNYSKTQNHTWCKTAPKREPQIPSHSSVGELTAHLHLMSSPSSSATK